MTLPPELGTHEAQNPVQRDLAQRALAEASSGGDATAEVAARYALGWAQFVLGDAATAKATLRTGIGVADRNGDRQHWQLDFQ